MSLSNPAARVQRHTRSNPLFLIFDIRALWRSVLSARVPKYQKLKMVGQTNMAKCRVLMGSAVKGLTFIPAGPLDYPDPHTHACIQSAQLCLYLYDYLHHSMLS